MKFIEIKAVFKSPDISLAEELITDVFFTAGLKGVICDVPILEPDEGFGTHTMAPLEKLSVTGYLPVSDSSNILLEQIRRQMSELSGHDIFITIETGMVDEKDWENSWKEFFHVSRISSRIVIKPEWRTYEPEPGDIVIAIDPGMAFGTGTHPSTSMCLQLMDTHFLPGFSFLDVGTGSGILMIAAAKLGASFSEGIDNDEMAVEVARQNLSKNQILPERFHLACTTLDKFHLKTYDFIAANIIARVIIGILDDIHKRLAPEGIAILSGLVIEQEDMILSALERHHFKIIQKNTGGEWLSLAIQKEQ